MKRSQNPLAARHRGSPAGGPERIHACRRLRDSGEKRNLRPAQIFDRFIEIAARRVSDPANPVPVGNDTQVMRENRFSSVSEGESQCRQRFDELSRIGPRTGVLQSRHLHGKGRGPGNAFPVLEVLTQGADHPDRIDSRMHPETTIFNSKRGRHDSRRKRLDGPIAKLLIGSAADLTEKRAVSIPQKKGRLRSHEPCSRDRNGRHNPQGTQHQTARSGEPSAQQYAFVRSWLLACDLDPGSVPVSKHGAVVHHLGPRRRLDEAT